MPRFWPRLLKSVLPIALLAGGAGYLYAVAAGAYVADERNDGGGVRDALAWRVPLAMAAWGGGITLVFEWLRHLWGVKARPAADLPAAAAVDAETLLLQLLEQAEAAEKARQQPVSVSTDTPPPVGTPAGQPTPAL